MIPVLSSLVALQQLDTAAEAVRKRLAELPAADEALVRKLGVATTELESAKARLAENHVARREFEKQVAAVDTRLSRFEDHRAAVKTNHEYTALLSEIATAKAEKDKLEEEILVTMEAADGIAADIKAAEQVLTQTTREVGVDRAKLGEEKRALEAELARLGQSRSGAVAGLDAPVLARYEQLLKQRRMIAVAEMVGELCTACHVRMRPAVAQSVRRNAAIVQCDSCQRILYFKGSPAVATEPSSAMEGPGKDLNLS